MNKKGLAELAGEYCREASVLVLVFGFLDGYRDNNLSYSLVGLIFAISFALFWIGYIFEQLKN
jgi:hypothetical protein